MGCIGSPATATTRPPRNGPIHRQVRAPSKSVGAVVGVAMAEISPLCGLRSTTSGSMQRSAARPDTHRDPRTSAPAPPNTDYTTGHVETPLRASGHSLLPTRPGRGGRRPTDDLWWELCRLDVHVVP